MEKSISTKIKRLISFQFYSIRVNAIIDCVLKRPISQRTNCEVEYSNRILYTKKYYIHQNIQDAKSEVKTDKYGVPWFVFSSNRTIDHRIYSTENKLGTVQKLRDQSLYNLCFYDICRGFKAISVGFSFSVFISLNWTILYDRYIPIQTLIMRFPKELGLPVHRRVLVHCASQSQACVSSQPART